MSSHQATLTASRRSPVPVRSGIGLKPQHFDQILAERPDVGWFEVHPENYFVDGGPLHHYLGRIRADYPLSFHSTGMSPGSADGIDEAHMKRLAELCRRYEPALVSDHLSWSRWAHSYLNDLLPMPYTTAALQVCCDNVDRIQELLGRTIALENPSVYLALPMSDMDECEFLLTLVRRTGASILLDINNLHVSGCNLGWSPQDYIKRIPAGLVSEIHLAGHLVETTETGTFLIDDHGSRVCPETWALYRQALDRLGTVPTLIEWDTEVPGLDVLLEEAGMAEALLKAPALEPAHA